MSRETVQKNGISIFGTKVTHSNMCIANSPNCGRMCEKRFAHGHWSFLGPRAEKKWCGTRTYKLNGKWDRVAEDMMLNFSESGYRGTGQIGRLMSRVFFTSRRRIIQRERMDPWEHEDRSSFVNTTPQMTYFLGEKRVQNHYRKKL